MYGNIMKILTYVSCDIKLDEAKDMAAKYIIDVLPVKEDRVAVRNFLDAPGVETLLIDVLTELLGLIRIVSFSRENEMLLVTSKEVFRVESPKPSSQREWQALIENVMLTGK